MFETVVAVNVFGIFIPVLGVPPLILPKPEISPVDFSLDYNL